MGMDVYGQAPTAEVGRYFRSGGPFWPPLWEYCIAVAPHVAGRVRYGFSNDGDGMCRHDAAELAQILTVELESGRTAKYEADHRRTKKVATRERCYVCGGAGTRASSETSSAGDPCGACDGGGWAGYKTDGEPPFLTEDISRFRDFVEASGGFEIW